MTWSYAVSSGSLGSTATVSQADNVFTITPSTDTANVGTFSLTFSVTDGINGVVSAVSSFTLQFSVTNSRYTVLDQSRRLQLVRTKPLTMPPLQIIRLLLLVTQQHQHLVHIVMVDILHILMVMETI